MNHGLGIELSSPERFDSVSSVAARLEEVAYLSDEAISTVVFLADRLGKPVLVEGPAGTGKTELAKSVAEITSSRLIRLQCYEGLDESKALYEWNYRKQLLRIQAGGTASRDPSHNMGSSDDERGAAKQVSSSAGNDGWQQVSEDIFSEEFLLERPLLAAIRSREPVVLLIDEVDRVEMEAEALLLEVLSDYQVSIPEMGTVRASQVPLVFLTSNNTRELSEALVRRCLYLHMDYPDVERERRIIRARVPGISERLADQVARIVRLVRTIDLKKQPSVAETLDWARTLVLLGIETVGPDEARSTLQVLCKHASDIERASKDLFSSDLMPGPEDLGSH
ncbi:MAG: AAA family ATPase [Acidimicrobiales bacterium]